MTTLNGVPFRKIMVATAKHSIKSPYTMDPKKITYHNTDNEMPAINEINYMRNNNLAVSYHVAVDEKEAIQALPFNRNGFHAGDGGNGYGNRNTVGMEICRNYDRTRRTTRLIEPLAGMYSKAELNAIKVGAQLHKDLNIPATVNTVKKHQDWSGKNCPSKILNEARWSAFQVAVILEYNRLVGKGPVASTNVHTVAKGDTLSGIAKKHSTTVAALVKENGIRNANILSIGQKVTIPTKGASVTKPSSPTPSKKSSAAVAQEVIDGKWGTNPQRKSDLEKAGYNYTEVQGIVNRIIGGQQTKPKPVTKSIDQLAKEVIDGKHGQGDARKKSLGSQYSAVQARVNAILDGGKPQRKTVDQMAREVVAGKHGNGHAARQKSLGISNAEYQKVRAKVNRLSR